MAERDQTTETCPRASLIPEPSRVRAIQEERGISMSAAFLSAQTELVEQTVKDANTVDDLKPILLMLWHGVGR